MEHDLIITNGDAAGELLRRSIAGAEILPWRDVLHDGPVPFTEDLDELSAIRADFLASRGWGTSEQLRNDFEARDRGLAVSEVFDRVALWFEHDLFDQLQLLQILDWFEAHPPEPGKLLLVQSSTFLGTLTPEDIPDFRASEQPVTDEQLSLAALAWAAFRSDTPEEWAELMHRTDDALPYLKPAVLRMLEELPDQRGLNRTERQMLQPLLTTPLNPPQMFALSQRQEEAMFMGDWSFWALLDGLAFGETPLVEGLENAFAGPDDATATQVYLQSTVELTEFGKAVLAAEEDRYAENTMDRWWGGTRLTDENLWRWNADSRSLIPPGVL
ncbi:hypothetical protein V6C03_11880 [Methyloligella sp. 2.7D]|uniref:hypothetical protein n=1 Tax=unclassified Methyloligella TaxID=2625955 RepID=UPI00157CDE7D|nr:hypothetical protein [Methyloligella sp. GL2]QKP77499.1 hypothetical protein HT051_08580 [Methyloligella sp. GL2]